jgi:hypothetical protein
VPRANLIEECRLDDGDGEPSLEARTPLELETELALPGGHIFHRAAAQPGHGTLGLILTPAPSRRLLATICRAPPGPTIRERDAPETTSLLEFPIARPEEFESPTFGSVDRRSIQLSYGREVAKCSRADPTARRGSRRRARCVA